MLNTANIQGNILTPFHFGAARYAILSFKDAASGRGLVARLAQEASTEASPPGNSALNVGLTFAGLSKLGVPANSLASFSQEFREGMAARAQQLNDVGPNSPANWENDLGSANSVDKLHLYVSVHAKDTQTVDQRFSALKALFDQSAVTVFSQDALANANHTEHFGYRDALADTAIEGTATPPEGHGLPMSNGTWRGVRPGEFVFGYNSELGEPPGAPPLAPIPSVLSTDGTYLVIRKLHQHVAAFRRYLSEQAAKLHVDLEWLAAKLVGRWRDGTPLALSPDKPWGPSFPQNIHQSNLFRYSNDRDGVLVPRGAHIRRVNPRDGLLHGVDFVRSHRIVRRGLPYGSELPEGADDDGKDRGVMFIALNTSIEAQFEFVQSTWVESGSFTGLNSEEKDPVLGGHNGQGIMTIPMPNGKPPKRLFSMPSFVTLRFGAYVFLPGIEGLKWLGAGNW